MNDNRPTDEQIRRRAREIFLRNGSKPGHDLDNWLQAERELSQSSGRPQRQMETSEVRRGR
jgi:hypothetical protein